MAKFSYLKSFAESKVKLLIDGIPFTAKGYNREERIF